MIKKINNLKSKKITIFEPNLKKIFEKKFNKTLFFKDNYEDINRFDIIFITVGTPYNSNKVDLSSIKNSIRNILKNYNKKKKITIVIKSTVPPGTTNYLQSKFFSKFKNLTLINNPEFLREGNAVEDFIKPEDNYWC